MSFFLKGKPRSATKRKFIKNEVPDKSAKSKPKSRQAEALEEELNSEDEEVNDAASNASSIDDHLGHDNEETPQNKRLRLAKKYLSEIEKEERMQNSDDEAADDHIATRLREDYLDSVGKLKRNVAEKYKGFQMNELRVLKDKKQKSPITCICLSADDKVIFTGSKHQFIVKYDVESGTKLGKIDCSSKSEKKASIVCMALSSDSKFLAVGANDHNIQIWNAQTLDHVKNLPGHRDVVTGLVFRKGTHDLYSTSGDKTLKSWSVDDLAYIETMFGHQSPVTSIDALFREKAITSGGMDRSIRIWKIPEESQLVFNGHHGNIECVKLINEENFISASDDGSLCLWSSMKKKPVHTVSLAHGKSSAGEPNWISAVATMLNTDMFASGSCDGHVRIWKISANSKSMDQVLQLPVKGFVNALAFTGDGKKLIVGVGQEHRLGRWWIIKEATNSILVVPFSIES